MNKKYLYGILAVLLLIAVTLFFDPQLPGLRNSSMKPDAPSQSSEQENVTYTCPMHPSVISDHPGACPICGMSLVKKILQQESTGSELEQLREVSLSPTQRILANITTISVSRQPIIKDIHAVGIVDVAEPMKATIAARFRGRIEKLYADVTGSKVNNGDPLFELYSPDLLSAEQELLLALSAQPTSGNTMNDPSIRLSLVDAARTRLRHTFGMTDSQIKELEHKREVLPSIVFTSPVSGTILSKAVQEGTYVNEGTLLYEIADLSSIWVNLDIYEHDVAFLHLQQRVKISNEMNPLDTLTGLITFIDPTVNPETRTVRVRAELPNPQSRWKPQMWVRASIAIEEKTTLVVPQSAILRTGKRNIVWVETKQNTFEPRDVTLGIESESSAEVLSNLSEGEKIVVTGGYLIDSESQLQTPSTSERTPTADGQDDGNEIRIIVKGGYAPDVIRLKKGKPTRLNFYRDEDSRCSEEILIPVFHIKKMLPAYKHTIIEITPDTTGSFTFTCGMEMLTGTIIVVK